VTFFGELRRRNVFTVGAAYAIVAVGFESVWRIEPYGGNQDAR